MWHNLVIRWAVGVWCIATATTLVADDKPTAIRRTAEQAAAWGLPMEPDAVDAEIARLNQAGFPLIDYHVHLTRGLTIADAVARSRATGIRYGVAANCGLKFPIATDRDVKKYVENMKGQTVFVAMQAEGREWRQLFSPAVIAQFDYVFTDGMTFTDHRGQRVRLWVKKEVDVPDKEAFVDLLTKTIVGILRDEPIDIYVNPTYLPEVIANDYDQLWTPARQTQIIKAAVANGVAIEINNGLRLPKAAFIKQAKEAGVKFTFGSNNLNAKFGRLEYCMEMIKECGLTAGDMWKPAAAGQKPVERRGIKR